MWPGNVCICMYIRRLSIKIKARTLSRSGEEIGGELLGTQSRLSVTRLSVVSDRGSAQKIYQNSHLSMAISSVNIHGLSFFEGLASCRIFVAVLVRPLNQTEQASEVEVAWDWSERSILARENNWKVEGESKSEHFWQDIDEEDYVADPIDEINSNNFHLERVFGPTSTTREVYDVGAKNIVLSVLDGINGAVFAYGQTGSGKTFTLSEIAENAICDIYEHIENRPERRFFLKFSAFEIYNETVMDLMKQKRGSLPDIDDPKEEGITVENLGEVAVKSIQHLRSLIKSCKAPSQTSDRSSRSTRIIRLAVENRPRQCRGHEESYIAHLDLVDLAGSEFAEDVPLDLGMAILREVMRLTRLHRMNAYEATEESKLTQILGNSLLRNSRNAIICTISPTLSDAEQARKTLSFAVDAACVKNHLKLNKIDQHNNGTEVETQLASREHASSDLRCESLLNVKKLRIQKMKKQLKKVKRQRDSLLKDLKEVERHRDLEMKKLKDVERQDLQILKVMKELKKGHDLGSELSNVMFKLGLVQRQGRQLMRSSRAKGSLQVSPTEGTHEVVA